MYPKVILQRNTRYPKSRNYMILFIQFRIVLKVAHAHLNSTQLQAKCFQVSLNTSVHGLLSQVPVLSTKLRVSSSIPASPSVLSRGLYPWNDFIYKTVILCNHLGFQLLQLQWDALLRHVSKGHLLDLGQELQNNFLTLLKNKVSQSHYNVFMCVWPMSVGALTCQEGWISWSWIYRWSRPIQCRRLGTKPGASVLLGHLSSISNELL